MKSKFQTVSVLVWLTQLGLSVVCPPVLFVLGGIHLQRFCGFGGWVTVLGTVLGVLGAAGGLVSSFRTLHRLGKSEENTPPGFNGHE